MTLIYGHRGAKGEAPENTLQSFRQCLSHGVDRCELDLHLSADNELMVIHDPTSSAPPAGAARWSSTPPPSW